MQNRDKDTKRAEQELDMKNRKSYNFNNYLYELVDSIESDLEEVMMEMMEINAFMNCQKKIFSNMSEEILEGYKIAYVDKKEELKILTEQYKVYNHILNNFDDYKEIEDEDIIKAIFLIETKRGL